MEEMLKERQSAEYIRERLDGCRPELTVVLGSGLGGLADSLEHAVSIKYEEIPHFPVSTVPGHASELVFGNLGGKQVLAMKGRFHFYEGYSMREVTYPVRVMKFLGVGRLILTNASGGVNTGYAPGDLMLIRDHIKLFDDSPLRGKNDDALGVRFPDMSCTYSEALRTSAREAARQMGLPLQEGVYFYMPGPSFETPAEIRAIRTLGGDAVGMSTVPEAISARHAGLEVLGISCISNMAAGILPQPLTHDEVIETGARVAEKFVALLRAVIERI